VQVGACQIYRYRAGLLSPLMRDHARPMPDGRRLPTRAIGLDVELSIDYTEETVEPADRYILLSGLEHTPPDTLYTTLAEQLAGPAFPSEIFAPRLLAALGGLDTCAMVLDIAATPPSNALAWSDNLADLPLRPAPREGDVWDGFALGKTLYRGRYTMLKAAYDTIEKREVALKIPLPSMLQDEIFTAGFMREAWIGSTVRGAAIARYLDLAPDRRSSLYLVMPLYKGETLESRLHRGPAIGLPDGIGIALKLCEAVQDLAAIQIVHRDIKPENIMLLEGNEIRLLDLGLAYLPGIDVADAVKPGGTIRYMAPELLQGTGANARTEVYALAITIYRMFAGGAYPFGQREAVPLARLRPDLPHWLGHCLGRALAAKPAERFADAGEFACAIQLGLISGAETGATPPKTFPLTPLQIWQALAFLFAAATVFLLLRGAR
jgi:tRNA A-37 threonylcarbamoyl transferase component Bud32